jgi:hypothetical protein
MRHMLLLTLDVRSEDDLVNAIDKVMEVPCVTRWTSDVLSPEVHRELRERGYVITHHKKARNWTAVAKASIR